MRLKLSTPLQVGVLLFDAAEEILAAERGGVRGGGRRRRRGRRHGRVRRRHGGGFRRAVGRRSIVRASRHRARGRSPRRRPSTDQRRGSVRDVRARKRRGKIRDAYGSRVLGDAEAELRAALAEHTGWLARNNERQLTAYEEAVRSRGSIRAHGSQPGRRHRRGRRGGGSGGGSRHGRSGGPDGDGPDGDGLGGGLGRSRGGLGQSRDALFPSDGSSSASASVASAADLVRKRFSEDVSPLAVAAGFNNAAAARLLEDEVREAVYSTVGAAGPRFSSPCSSRGSWIASRRTCSRSRSPRRWGTSAS